MAAVQRWQQWLSNRQQQPADDAASSPAAAPTAAAAAQPDRVASSCHASALSSSGGTSAPPSAPGSTVGSGEWSKAGSGKAPVGRSSLGLPSSCDRPGSSCCYTVEPVDDEFEDVYGADALTLRSAWRHTETWLAAYILAALLVAVVINIGVGASNSVRRNRVQGAALAHARPPPPPLRAWFPPPSGAPPLPPLAAQPQPQLSPPPAVLPLSPPPPASLPPPPSPAAVSEFAALGAGRSHLALSVAASTRHWYCRQGSAIPWPFLCPNSLHLLPMFHPLPLQHQWPSQPTAMQLLPRWQGSASAAPLFSFQRCV